MPFSSPEICMTISDLCSHLRDCEHGQGLHNNGTMLFSVLGEGELGCYERMRYEISRRACLLFVLAFCTDSSRNRVEQSDETEDLWL
jgi:hypothetical protein